MEHLEAHFINRYRILINKGHLLFTEHQKFWKSIKNSSQKVKKCEIFSRFWTFSEHFRKNLDFENVDRNFDRKCWSKFWPKFQSIFSRFIFATFFKIWKYFTFFTFWDGFFMNFQNFWCSGKRRSSLLIRIQYLFMKYSSKFAFSAVLFFSPDVSTSRN